MLCIVSCFKKYFVAAQLSSLNLDSFIFQLRQWALESQGVSGYLKTLIFGPETSKLRLKYLSRVFFFKAGRTKRQPKASLTRERISFDSKADFLFVGTALPSFIFDILLKLLFFSCLEIIMTSYVKNYFWSKYYLLSEFGRSRNVLKNVSQSFFRLFLNLFFSHDGCKTVTAMCACGEFPWKLENNQLSDCSIIFFFYVKWKFWWTFRGFVPNHRYLKLVSADQNLVYLPLKWQILAVMARI